MTRAAAETPEIQQAVHAVRTLRRELAEKGTATVDGAFIAAQFQVLASAYIDDLEQRDREAAEQAAAVDEEWALATFERGNSPDRNTKRFWFGDEAVLAEAYACAGPKCWNWALYCYGNYVKNDPTRGDVLRLLAALGISVERGGE